jgi:membrane protein involved in colicin uptake
MSDVLLKEISTKLSDIHAALKGGAAANGGAVAPPKAAANKAADKAAAADKTAADKPKAADKAAANNKAGASQPAGTKAPGGKHTIEEVRSILRDVATNPALGKASALAILDENGGVDHLGKLKPENFDAVYEAAQVELSGASSEGGAAEDDGLGL